MIILNIKKRLVVNIEVLVASEPVGVTCIKIYARQKKNVFMVKPQSREMMWEIF